MTKLAQLFTLEGTQKTGKFVLILPKDFQFTRELFRNSLMFIITLISFENKTFCIFRENSIIFRVFKDVPGRKIQIHVIWLTMMIFGDSDCTESDELRSRYSSRSLYDRNRYAAVMQRLAEIIPISINVSQTCQSPSRINNSPYITKYPVLNFDFPFFPLGESFDCI